MGADRATDGAPVGVVIAAAGRSERAGPGAPKQFRLVGGVPMLLRSTQPFLDHPRVHDVIITLPPHVAAAPPPWLEALRPRVRLVPGGATRALSVKAGLEALEPTCTLVLVHDAARPFVSRETIDAVIALAARGVGAVPAVRVRDTLKRAQNGAMRITETVDRTGLWCAHTPQGFPRAMLEAAYRRATGSLGQGATDEAALVEAAGYDVELVPDLPNNIKITSPQDFVLAQAIAAT